MQLEPLCSEVDDNLWVGSVGAREDPRWVAVVGILSEPDRWWVGAEVAMPQCSYLLAEHAERQPGLLNHPDLAEAWRRISEGVRRGPVLVHCLQGASRSVAVAAGWMLAHQRREDGRHLTTKDVVDRVFHRRLQAVHLWPGYIDELLDLERLLRELDRAERVVRENHGIPTDLDFRDEVIARLRDGRMSCEDDLVEWQMLAAQCNL